MKRIPALLLGSSLIFGAVAISYGQEAKVKEETKIKEKHGKYKETTKATTSDSVTGEHSSQKTKIKSKHGKTKITTEIKGSS